MKKILFVLMCLALFVLFGCSDKQTIVGKWVDDETGDIVEYTEDGYYYEYQNENFTSDKTKYEINDDKICYYLEGDEPENGFEVSFSFDKDGNLVRHLKDVDQIYLPYTDKPEKDGEEK